MSNRDTLRTDAFAEGSMEVAGLRLRTLSIGAITQCKKMGLTLFTGAASEAGEEDMMWQVSAVLWLLSQPLNIVLEAIRQDRWRPLVEEFQFTLEMASVPQIMAEVRRLSEQSSAAAVDVIPKPGKGEEGAPPNS